MTYLTAYQNGKPKKFQVEILATLKMPNLRKMKVEMEAYLVRTYTTVPRSFSGLVKWRSVFKHFLLDLDAKNQNIGVFGVLPKHVEDFKHAKDRPGQSYRRQLCGGLRAFFQEAETIGRIKKSPFILEPKASKASGPIHAIRPDFDLLIQLRADFELHLNYMARSEFGYSPNSISSYRSVYRQFLAYCERHKKNITLAHVDGPLVRAYVLSKRKLAAGSTRLAQGALSAFFDYQVFIGSIPRSPILRRISRKSKIGLPRPLPEEKLAFLVSIPDRTTFTGLIDYAVLVATLSAGLRISEVHGLTWDSLFPFATDPYMEVTGKGSKERKVPLTTTTLDAFMAIRKRLHYTPEGRDPIFVSLPWIKTRYHIRRFSERLRNVFIKAGLGDCTFHQTRHTAASHWLAWGIPPDLVRELLGHKSFSTTRIYGRFTNKQMAAAVKKFGPRCDVKKVLQGLESMPR